MGKLRLDVGGGHQPYVGYQIVDQLPTADVVHDLTQPLPFKDGTVHEIFASHVLEHFPLWQIVGILVDWHRVLEPKTGLFWGFVPDGEPYVKLWQRAVKQKDWNLKRECLAVFHGGGTNDQYTGPGQHHYALYDEQLLQETISRAGFHPVVVWHQQVAKMDYRLVFAAGKGVYEPMDIRMTQAYPSAPWHTPPWEEVHPAGKEE